MAKSKHGSETALAKNKKGELAKSNRSFTVASLEKALLKEFPKKDAESWDVMGLTVGEGALPVTHVAVALDPTVEAIERASRVGASVLVTHHPPFLEGPMSFAPAKSVAINPGAGVWAAITKRVALMNFHTALDVSKRAQEVLPKMLGFEYTGKLLERIESSNRKGYGQICHVPTDGKSPESLEHIAAKCNSMFRIAPKVYGNMSSRIRTCATVLGSAGSIGRKALAKGIDCLICGEIKYHEALELSQAGLAIIELGHDVSELPLTAVLAKTIADIGFAPDKITIIDQTGNWSYPETIRL